jgi:hypothetical protein
MDSKKGAGAALMLEIVLATIIFFVVLTLVFAYDIGDQTIIATAVVTSPDSIQACNKALNSFLKSEDSTTGLENYELLVKDYMNEPVYSNSILAAQNFFEKAYGTNNYSLKVYHKLNPVIDLGSTQVVNPFTCHTIVPLPIVGLSYECTFIETVSISPEGPVEFQTPSGTASCNILNTLTFSSDEPGELGIDLSPDCQRLEPELGVLDEDYNPATTPDTNELNMHAVDLNISDEIYTLVIIECALNLELTIPGTKRFQDIAEWCNAQKAEGKQCI